ncbi:hypothetical protein Pan216_15970 [Planctomycetes bacterium Pan216]|uniref:Uncharacterized protein n=1 Tax=Kolteria novifilia TaxID=2527975 RepID=A0A518B1A9_9BACT|nr:hypothetical protein Pan216_15970 [Planctomycetes bacterium Pan216]
MTGGITLMRSRADASTFGLDKIPNGEHSAGCSRKREHGTRRHIEDVDSSA